MKVLITGGAGFIGSNLTHHIRSAHPEAEIVVIDDLSTGSVTNLGGTGAEFVKASILDADALDEAMDGVDSVVHLAALGSVPRSIEAPMASHHANATGTLAVLESARRLGVRHIVAASSSSVYGSNTKLPKNEQDWTRPLSPYGVSKQATEGYVLAFGTSYGMQTLAFRFFNVFGPRQAANHVYAAVIPRFIEAALNGEPVIVHGDGQQSRDFTFVRTVTQTLLSAVETRLSSSAPINLAYGTNTSLLQLLHEMEEHVGRPLTRRHVADRVGDVRDSQADGLSIREAFPELVPVPFVEGLRETIEWYKSQRTTA